MTSFINTNDLYSVNRIGKRNYVVIFTKIFFWQAIGFYLILSMSIAISLVGFFTLQKMADISESIYEGPEKINTYGWQLDAIVTSAHRNLAVSFLSRNEKERLRHLEVATFYTKKYNTELIPALEKLIQANIIDKKEGMEALDKIKLGVSKWEELNAQSLQAYERGDMATVKDILQGDAKDYLNVAFSGLARILEMAEGSRLKLTAQADDFRSDFTIVMAFLLVLCIATGAALAFFITKSVTVPLLGLQNAMRQLSSGELDVDIPSSDAKDETEEMANIVQIFKQNAIAKHQMEIEQQDAEIKQRELEQQRIETENRQKEETRRRELELEAQRQQELLELAARFEKDVSNLVRVASKSGNDMNEKVENMSNSVTNILENSTAANNAAKATSENVNAISATAEELSNSILSICEQTEEAYSMGSNANSKGLDVVKNVEHLSIAARKIDEIINLINNIAGKTNLLALNATIESARAGEMGKGFAVVAGEVKNLAVQTSSATQDIAHQIQEMQAATQTVADEISSVVSMIKDIGNFNQAISLSVKGQNDATAEIAHNTVNAATESNMVTERFRAVHEASTITGQISSDLQKNSLELTTNLTSLEQRVNDFLDGIRGKIASEQVDQKSYANA